MLVSSPHVALAQELAMCLDIPRDTGLVVAAAVVACAPTIDSTGYDAEIREIDLDILCDKARGGWAGR